MGRAGAYPDRRFHLRERNNRAACLDAIWTLTKTGDDTWRGSAEGVIGEATGQEAGDRFNWRYTIDLPQPDKGGTMRAEFDDWMWLLSDNRLLNIAYVERFGVRLGR